MTYRVLIFSLIFTALILPASIGAWVTLSLAISTPALAQEKEKKRKPRGRRSEVLGKRAFRITQAAQEKMAEEKYADARADLQIILDGEKFTPYEKAVAWQSMGYVAAAEGNYAQTIAMFERALAVDALPPRVILDLNYNLIQLNLAEGKAKKAQRLLDKWLADSGVKPSADIFGLKAQIHLILEEFTAAEQAARRAVAMENPPKAKWLRVLVAALLQQEKFAAARPHLERAVELYPAEKSFWQQLTAVYFKANEEKRAFMVQKTMYLQGMLQSSSELSTLAQLYLYHNVPIKAAEVIEKALAEKKIEETEKTYEMLANAYMYAREWDKSIRPLRKAAERSQSGKFYIQIGQSYLQDEKWQEAEAALAKGLDKGKLKDAGNGWLLLGIARVRQQKFKTAIAAFRKASDDDDLATDAFRWIRSIENRLVEERRRREAEAASSS